MRSVDTMAENGFAFAVWSVRVILTTDEISTSIGQAQGLAIFQKGHAKFSALFFRLKSVGGIWVSSILSGRRGSRGDDYSESVREDQGWPYFCPGRWIKGPPRGLAVTATWRASLLAYTTQSHFLKLLQSILQLGYVCVKWMYVSCFSNIIS